MKKVIITAMFAIAAASAVPAQTRAVDRQGGMMIQGRPFFTDGGNYNSYDLFGSPAGRFDIDSVSRLDVETGYKYFSLGNESGSYLSGQTVRMGEPGRAFFELAYGPDFLSRENAGGAEASLTLHRVGLALAARSAAGNLRWAFSADAYYGNQKWKGAENTRMLAGVERLRIDMGSQVHPLARIIFYVGANLHVDTLHTPGNVRNDRSAQTNLPEFGANVDLGGDGMPLRSNIAFSYAMSRFVYTTTVPGPIPRDVIGDAAPAILNDSLRFYWLITGDIPVNDDFTVTPGLLLGYSGNNGKECVPDYLDNHPLNIGSAKPGWSYELNGFHFGAGAGAGLMKYADLHVEYSLSAMSLDYGNQYPVQPVRSRTLHRTMFGASTRVHKYLDLPLEITPRIAYFISGSSGAAGGGMAAVSAPHSNLGPLNTVAERGQRPLYEPYRFLESFQRTSGFTIGVDALTLESRLAPSFWITFLSKNTESGGGIEMGLAAGFKM